VKKILKRNTVGGKIPPTIKIGGESDVEKSIIY